MKWTSKYPLQHTGKPTQSCGVRSNLNSLVSVEANGVSWRDVDKMVLPLTVARGVTNDQ